MPARKKRKTAARAKKTGSRGKRKSTSAAKKTAGRGKTTKRNAAKPRNTRRAAGEERSKTAREWKAVQDRQPLPPWSLRVTGSPKMPSPQHKPTLKRAVPQGFNPRHLILDLVATPPGGMTTPVVTPVPVSYQEEGTLEFDKVLIRSSVSTEPGGLIDVEVVH